MRAIGALLDKGVDIPNPLSLDIGTEVDVDRISADGVTIHPGCRIRGGRTVISAGVTLGSEGPQEVHGLANAQKLAILVAMSVTEQMSLADVKNRLSEVVDRLQKEHGRVVITKHGHPAAVVISLDDLGSLEETLDVMDSAALLDDIREALADSDAQVLSKEDALRLITDR